MYIIKVENLNQARNVREFMEERAGMTFNKDFTVQLGNAVIVPVGMPYGEQINWKFLES